MLLAQLLDGVPVTKIFSMLYGKMLVTADLEVRRIQYDSRRVERGDLFVAIRGTAMDGHAYIQHAVERGAGAVMVEDDKALQDSYFLHTNVTKIVVQNSRKALAIMSANAHDNPSAHLRVIGVTGTNGKTTTTHLIKAVLESAGETVGLIGTIGYYAGAETINATHTTPESLELQELLATMRTRGCTSVVMEVSSHALSMSRVHGTRFTAAVFTNLTQDHLDFHGSMENYFAAKKTLFAGLDKKAVAVTNGDDPRGLAMTDGTAARTIVYGKEGDVRADEVSMSMSGMQAQILWPGTRLPIHSSLTGQFNVANILAAAATGYALGVRPEQVGKGIEHLTAVRGRFEQVLGPEGRVAVVDYAHTPDALENCLSTIRTLLPSHGRIITVFGCGGDRDRGKRPIMGKIASSMSALTFVTSDNPRKEDPKAIIANIMAGVVSGADVRVEPDRRTAIRAALREAKPGDVTLIAGKGHETYQVTGEVKSPFDDRAEVESFFRESR
jgi:UDP-N-acetylmuramoyl-L-alanyl-D-glutamate--2,6-diaminopimelate ligase